MSPAVEVPVILEAQGEGMNERPATSWPLKQQWFCFNDLEFRVEPNGDGAVIYVKLGFKQRAIYISPAGAVTHARNWNDPELVAQRALAPGAITA